MRQWFLFYAGGSLIGQQAVDQITQLPVSYITQIPWGHNLAIIAKCKNIDEAFYYVQNTITHGWSRSVLTHQIESGLWQRDGKAISNFTKTLPASRSDLARQTFKDPYVLDFIMLTKEHNERELERGLIKHITQFLLELGAGFAYIGRQVPLQVGERDFFIDYSDPMIIPIYSKRQLKYRAILPFQLSFYRDNFSSTENHRAFVGYRHCFPTQPFPVKTL